MSITPWSQRAGHDEQAGEDGQGQRPLGDPNRQVPEHPGALQHRDDQHPPQTISIIPAEGR